MLDVKPPVCFPFLKYLKIKKNALYLFCIIVYEEWSCHGEIMTLLATLINSISHIQGGEY